MSQDSNQRCQPQLNRLALAFDTRLPENQARRKGIGKPRGDSLDQNALLVGVQVADD